MRASPGSLRWLVGQQLAWQWRGLGGRQRRGLVAALVIVALLTLGGYVGLRPLLAGANLNAPLPDPVLGPVLLAEGFLLTVMVSAAVRAALEALFTRGDLDLLLHSPVPPRTVLASRALGVALSAGLASALILVPLLLILLVLGAWRGIGLLSWWASASLLAGSLGLWLTLGLVRWLGVRRTRTAASVVGAVLGASVFLLSQWGNLSGGDGTALFAAVSRFAPGVGGWPGSQSPLWFPARAAWLEPLPLLALLVASGLIFAGTVTALTRQFTRGVQEAGESGGRRERPGGRTRPLRFAPGTRATLLKEWRLIGRDPEVLSRTLLQLVYLVPLFVSVGRASVRGAAGAAAVLLTANLASSLARLTLDAEDAPDLLVSAPRSPAALRREKWLAAALPPALLGTLALLSLAARGVLGPGAPSGLPLLGLVLLGTGGAALMVLWQPLPLRRADAFRKREARPLVNVIFSLVFQLALSAAAYATTRGQAWGLAALLVALLALGVVFGLRRSDVR
ncbi:hypothetical protein [Deinococcus apachensis]|uniref:hypothetical protein n=1 Tax=Deinococcus apachensis TaxID=309886 RepID=UPI0003807D21|nr:hypothetical protein [Deinococcus apachensis]